MTLMEHMGEARRRLLIAFAAILVAGVVAFIEYPWILHLLQSPYCHVNSHCTFLVTSPLDGLSLRIKIALFGGLILSSPVVFWEIWRFITPGLKTREKRYAIPFLLATVIFFLAGCAVAYFSFEHALKFLESIGGKSLHTYYNPNAYLSLIMLMMFIFGVTFEFPVILVGLELAHVVTSRQLLRSWRYALIGITIASAVFTPSGDPLSMFALAIPLVAFYFIAILIGRLFRR
jgi:sec-independent protein translocase protein TatC